MEKISIFIEKRVITFGFIKKDGKIPPTCYTEIGQLIKNPLEDIRQNYPDFVYKRAYCLRK